MMAPLLSSLLQSLPCPTSPLLPLTTASEAETLTACQGGVQVCWGSKCGCSDLPSGAVYGEGPMSFPPGGRPPRFDTGLPSSHVQAVGTTPLGAAWSQPPRS
ncbi:hypothetical protein BS78_09G094300 [Paspalum vaginatum]|nr:hypothetical protein BS78_09G094300 [Paspalum vaginatum]KAJ1262282.1 hypothetical protein BS78_09G094300 [Paspalum vaginatum]